MDVSSNLNNPPDPPSSPSPQDGKTGVAVKTTLSWSGGDPDGDEVSYDVYFGTSSPPPLKKSGHTTTSYNPGTLTQGTSYHWQVVAKDPQGGDTLMWHQLRETIHYGSPCGQEVRTPGGWSG
ncbi:MAG: hypothetical protein ACE5OR_10755 [bacterium]